MIYILTVPLYVYCYKNQFYETYFPKNGNNAAETISDAKIYFNFERNEEIKYYNYLGYYWEYFYKKVYDPEEK